MVSIRAVGWEGPGNDEIQLKGGFSTLFSRCHLVGMGGGGLKAMLLQCLLQRKKHRLKHCMGA